MSRVITLANLAEASAQEVFDQIVTHLTEQNVRSSVDVDGVNKCMYRNPDGLKCAAGCLIADSEYTAEMEGDSWNGLIIDGLVNTDKHKSLIDELQYVHDVKKETAWFHEFAIVAKNNNLHYTHE